MAKKQQGHGGRPEDGQGGRGGHRGAGNDGDGDEHPTREPCDDPDGCATWPNSVAISGTAGQAGLTPTESNDVVITVASRVHVWTKGG